jgi:hypothetical protein
MRNTLHRSIDRFAVILLTAGLTAWLEFSFTMEWSSPYCMSQEDGPAYAAFGFPLPYMRFGGASSMEYAFMPHAYLINLLVLCALALPAVRWLLRRPSMAAGTRKRFVAGLVGALLITARLGLLALTLSMGMLQPTASIGSLHEPYTDLRPVGPCLHDGHYECTPSPFWFPDGWQHD